MAVFLVIDFAIFDCFFFACPLNFMCRSSHSHALNIPSRIFVFLFQSKRGLRTGIKVDKLAKMFARRPKAHNRRFH